MQESTSILSILFLYKSFAQTWMVILMELSIDFPGKVLKLSKTFFFPSGRVILMSGDIGWKMYKFFATIKKLIKKEFNLFRNNDLNGERNKTIETI